MTLAQHLCLFYQQNNIPKNGGIEEDYFDFPVFGITLTLPNLEFRKKATYIHDLQHVLNNCDTSWKGEAFISGWEIGTGMWKHFPVSFLSLWAMGYALWLYPKEVYKGYKKGLNTIGIIDIQLSKEDFMKLSLEELQTITQKEKQTKMRLFQWSLFIIWCFVSEIILLFPLLIVLAIVLLMYI
ncbi:hypothetical protein [Wenyingzhuangia sp. IMCC45574]